MSSVIHELSSVTPHPDFDLFGVPPTQLTVEKDVLTEHRPISILNAFSVIQYTIPTAVDEYIQLRESLIYMKIKVNIKKKDGTNVVEADWAKVAPVNYFLHSLFKQVDLEIDGKSITLSPQTYAYKAYFESLLGFTKDAKESYLSASGYYIDNTSKSVVSTTASKFIKPQTIATTGEGESIELMGKLHLDLAFQPRALLGGSTLKFTLVPNEPNFYMMTSDDTVTPIVTFEMASLYIHRSKIAMSVVEGHNSALSRGTAKYPICRTQVRSFNVNTGTTTTSIDNAIHGQLPRRVFVTIVPNSAFSGNIKQNPYNFKHYNLTYIAVYIDGTQFPAKAFTPDFTKKLYTREYLGLFESLNQLTTDSVIALTKEQWADGNTIYGFNFAPDLGDDCCKQGYANPIKSGALRLELKFSEALTETISVLMYCEFDNLIEIDLNRQAITDYM